MTMLNVGEDTLRCSSCNGSKFKVVEKGPHKGLYCMECDAFQKWLSKKELSQLKSAGDGSVEMLVPKHESSFDDFDQLINEPIDNSITINRASLIKKLATDLAYLQINADWWFYCYHSPSNVEDERQRMSSHSLDLVTEIREIANYFKIVDDVYDEAYEIYDFRNSGKKDFKPDIKYIQHMHDTFCAEIKRTRVFM